MPLSDGSCPSVSSHTGEWFDPSSHVLAWSIPVISPSDDNRSVTFIGQGSLAGVNIVSATTINRGDSAEFSVDGYVTTENYQV
ncbi:hypothetical protein AX14_009307 [Amanita brunnescens Koide BX004]|nr:hypothetical protein AX14_009307 [Amanita brunnescens Koide BX004]